MHHDLVPTRNGCSFHGPVVLPSAGRLSPHMYSPELAPNMAQVRRVLSVFMFRADPALFEMGTPVHRQRTRAQGQVPDHPGDPEHLPAHELRHTRRP